MRLNAYSAETGIFSVAHRASGAIRVHVQRRLLLAALSRRRCRSWRNALRSERSRRRVLATQSVRMVTRALRAFRAMLSSSLTPATRHTAKRRRRSHLSGILMGPARAAAAETAVYANGRVYTRDFFRSLVLDASNGALLRARARSAPTSMRRQSIRHHVCHLPGWSINAESLDGTPLWTFTGDGQLNTAPLILNTGSSRSSSSVAGWAGSAMQTPGAKSGAPTLGRRLPARTVDRCGAVGQARRWQGDHRSCRKTLSPTPVTKPTGVVTSRDGHRSRRRRAVESVTFTVSATGPDGARRSPHAALLGQRLPGRCDDRPLLRQQTRPETLRPAPSSSSNER